VPATVQAVLAARIDRLPLGAKHLLQVATVIGMEVPFPLLHAVADRGARRRERFGQANLPAVQSLAFLAACHAELGMFAEGSTLGEEGLQIAEAVAHPSSLMWAYYGIGLLATRQGDLHRALPLLERAMGICQEAGLPLFVPRMAAALGTAYTLSGREEVVKV
jgi:hypothetical protein